jgi:hypothetical protein
MHIGVTGDNKGLDFETQGDKIAITVTDTQGKKGPEILVTILLQPEVWDEVTGFIQRQRGVK